MAQLSIPQTAKYGQVRNERGFILILSLFEALSSIIVDTHSVPYIYLGQHWI